MTERPTTAAGPPMPDVQRVSPPFTNRSQELAQAFREAVASVHDYAARHPHPFVSQPHLLVEDDDYNCPNEWCQRFWAMVRETEDLAAEARTQDSSALRAALEEIVDAAYPTGGTEGPNAWTEERIRDRIRFAEQLDRVLAALPPSAPPALDVDRLAEAMVAAFRSLATSKWPFLRGDGWPAYDEAGSPHQVLLVNEAAEATAAEYARLEPES